MNVRNTVSEVRKKNVFNGLSGFVQLGVVFETSVIAHVSPWVHNFLGKKKEFFKYPPVFADIWIFRHTKHMKHSLRYAMLRYASLRFATLRFASLCSASRYYIKEWTCLMYNCAKFSSKSSNLSRKSKKHRF